MMISQDLASSKETELLSFLDKNSDVFAWKASDLTGVSRDIIEHKLQVKTRQQVAKQWHCWIISWGTIRYGSVRKMKKRQVSLHLSTPTVTLGCPKILRMLA
jgi:hypothetical protein